MSKNSKQDRVSIRTSIQEARTVLDPDEEAERTLNRALGDHYRKVGAELSQPRDEWVQYLLWRGCTSGSIARSLESLVHSPECERDDLAAAFAIEIWADDCGDDLWASTFEEEMYWLEALHEIPFSERHW